MSDFYVLIAIQFKVDGRSWAPAEAAAAAATQGTLIDTEKACALFSDNFLLLHVPLCECLRPDKFYANNALQIKKVIRMSLILKLTTVVMFLLLFSSLLLLLRLLIKMSIKISIINCIC